MNIIKYWYLIYLHEINVYIYNKDIFYIFSMFCQMEKEFSDKIIAECKKIKFQDDTLDIKFKIAIVYLDNYEHTISTKLFQGRKFQNPVHFKILQSALYVHTYNAEETMQILENLLIKNQFYTMTHQACTLFINLAYFGFKTLATMVFLRIVMECEFKDFQLLFD